jgi:hypothetical protein
MQSITKQWLDNKIKIARVELLSDGIFDKRTKLFQSHKKSSKLLSNNKNKLFTWIVLICN